MRTKVKVFFYLEEDEEKKFLETLKEQGLKLMEIADEIGVSYSHLYQVVHGTKSLTHAMYESLEKYGLNVDFLKCIR